MPLACSARAKAWPTTKRSELHSFRFQAGKGAAASLVSMQDDVAPHQLQLGARSPRLADMPDVALNSCCDETAVASRNTEMYYYVLSVPRSQGGMRDRLVNLALGTAQI